MSSICFSIQRENRHTRGDAKDVERKRDQTSQLHKVFEMTDNLIYKGFITFM